MGIGFAPESVTPFYDERHVVVRPVAHLADATLVLAWTDPEPYGPLGTIVALYRRASPSPPDRTRGPTTPDPTVTGRH